MIRYCTEREGHKRLSYDMTGVCVWVCVFTPPPPVPPLPPRIFVGGRAGALGRTKERHCVVALFWVGGTNAWGVRIGVGRGFGSRFVGRAGEGPRAREERSDKSARTIRKIPEGAGRLY